MRTEPDRMAENEYARKQGADNAIIQQATGLNHKDMQ